MREMPTLEDCICVMNEIKVYASDTERDIVWEWFREDMSRPLQEDFCEYWQCIADNDWLGAESYGEIPEEWLPDDVDGMLYHGSADDRNASVAHEWLTAGGTNSPAEAIAQDEQEVFDELQKSASRGDLSPELSIMVWRGYREARVRLEKEALE